MHEKFSKKHVLTILFMFFFTISKLSSYQRILIGSFTLIPLIYKSLEHVSDRIHGMGGRASEAEG